MTSRRTVFRADDARGSVNITLTALQIRDERDRATIAHHEAAHAVLALAGGGRVVSVSLWRPIGSVWRGFTDMEFDETVEADQAAILALLAGTHAEHAWLRRNDIPPAAYPHDIEASGHHDRQIVRECLRRIPRDQRPSITAAESRAERLVQRHWHRIERLAARLITNGRIRNVTA